MPIRDGQVESSNKNENARRQNSQPGDGNGNLEEDVPQFENAPSEATQGRHFGSVQNI